MKISDVRLRVVLLAGCLGVATLATIALSRRFSVLRDSRLAVLAGLLVLMASSADAHHSSLPHFDPTKPVTLAGVITGFKLVNPHAYLYFDVTGQDGKVTHWNCEMTAGSVLHRSGWTGELFAPGAVVTVNAIAARRDPNGCSFTSAVLKDGTRIERSGAITRGGIVAKNADAATPQARNLTTLSGTWITTPRAGGGGPGSDNPFIKLMTAAGKAAAEKYDDRFDDPALRCSPSSIQRAWGEPGGVSEIVQTPTTITIKHEYMDTVRLVDLRTRQHPAAVKRSLTGHSVGWFEGSTLVIDTTGFASGVLLPHPGVINSEDMHVVERLSLSADGNQLVRNYEVTDAKFLAAPMTGTSSWTRTALPLSTYNCTELSGVNNVRPKAAR